MRIGRKAYPRDQPGNCPRKNPRKVERSIPRVEHVFHIEVMAAPLAVFPILRTFILILVPTRLVEHMRTLDDNFIALLERRLTEIACRTHHNLVIDHILAGVLRDILFLEDQIPDPRKNQLEEQIKQEYGQQPQYSSLQNDLKGSQPIDDYRIVDTSHVVVDVVRGYQAIPPVTADLELALHTPIDLKIGIDQCKPIIRVILVELFQNII